MVFGLKSEMTWLKSSPVFKLPDQSVLKSYGSPGSMSYSKRIRQLSPPSLSIIPLRVADCCSIEAAINVGAYSIALNTKNSNFFTGEFIKKADKIIELSEIPLKLIEAVEKLL